MALYGVIGDVHGNREALCAALARCEERGVDCIICVGDIVGYNADPDECAALLAERNVLAVAGNHDLISIGKLGFARCANKVVYSLKRTRRALAPRTIAYLGSLPEHRLLEERVLVCHAGVRDVERYLVTAGQVRQNAQELRADFPAAAICLFGHVHTQKVYEVDGNTVRELPAHGTVVLREDREYFLNAGSVDASRKRGEKRAEFAIFETPSLILEFFQISYNDELTEDKASAGGYRLNPLADRMYDWRRRLIGPRHLDSDAA